MVIAALAAVITACSPGPWQTAPDSQAPAARGFAAVACTDSQLVLIGGSLPPAAAVEVLVPGAHALSGASWVDVENPPLANRTRASAAAAADGSILVWGGSDGVVSGSGPDAFTYYTDGARWRDGTWDYIPQLPLRGAVNAQLVSVGNEFFIAGGDVVPGGVAQKDIVVILHADGTINEVPLPSNLGVLTGGDGVLHFGPKGVHRLAPEGEASWVQVSSVGISPKVGDSDGGISAVSDGDKVWLFDGATLQDVGRPPSSSVDTLIVAGSSVLVWDEESARLSIWNADSWTEVIGPDSLRNRVGSAICVIDDVYTVWGGWNDRGGISVAVDSGSQLRFGD